MQFATQIPIPAGNPPLDYHSRLVSLGSCFAVNIGQKLDYYKFSNITNPFGILFHPLALEKFIGYAVKHKVFTETDIFYHNERWHCFDAHSDLSSPDKETTLHNLNQAVLTASEALKNTSHIIITLGTAWVYRSIETGNLVANCHKVPQKEFSKELLSVKAIAQSLDSILNLVHQVNSKATVIFTISPVRHIKDGFIENQRSKAHLITALHETLQSANCLLPSFYFPAYEIMMDELRDYRFYSEDLVHPSLMGINYIWDCFVKAWINPESQPVMKEADAIQKSLLHRPYNPDSTQHTEFRQKLQKRITTLQEQYPHIHF
jgi:GSCFA family